ncbi:MAG: PfkB family carbohydrate kinase [Phycisphaerales bacterium]
MTPQPPRKILTRDELGVLRAEARERGRTVVQCHGCFDIVHPGHIRHLRFAKQQGDILLVSITADPLVNKGAGRPLFNADLRAENLAALDCVDWVFVNPEPTAEALLDLTRPDVYIKGREYESNDDPRFAAERRAVESHSGRVVFSSGDIVFSSSALIRALESDTTHRAEHGTDPRLATLRQLAASHDLSSPTLRDIIARIRGKRAVIVGEPIVDTYVSCDRPGVSSDAPCLSLKPIDEVRFDGGAGVIARHAAALGATPVLITALPAHDHAAQAMRRRLEDRGIEVRAVRSNAPLPEKQRYTVGTEKVFKLDLARDMALDAEAHDALHELVADACLTTSHADATILADFGLGLLTRRTVERLCATLRDRHGVLAGDVSGHRASLLAMKHADLLMPAESELRAAIGDHESSLNAVVWRLVEATSATAVCATMGEEGATLFQRRAVAFDATDGWRSWLAADHVPTLATHRVDPLGCGDAMLATATLALSAGATHAQSVFLGAVAAAIHAERIGNTPVTSDDLLARLDRIDSARLVVTAPTSIPARLLSAS